MDSRPKGFPSSAQTCPSQEGPRKVMVSQDLAHTESLAAPRPGPFRQTSVNTRCQALKCVLSCFFKTKGSTQPG